MVKENQTQFVRGEFVLDLLFKAQPPPRESSSFFPSLDFFSKYPKNKKEKDNLLDLDLIPFIVPNLLE